MKTACGRRFSMWHSSLRRTKALLRQLDEMLEPLRLLGGLNSAERPWTNHGVCLFG